MKSKSIQTKYGPGKIVGYKFFNEVKFVLIELEQGVRIGLRWNKVNLK